MTHTQHLRPRPVLTDPCSGPVGCGNCLFRHMTGIISYSSLVYTEGLAALISGGTVQQFLGLLLSCPHLLIANSTATALGCLP